MSTKITYESVDGDVTVEVPDDGMNIWELRDNLLRPLLLAAGYGVQTVNELFGEGDGE